MRDAEVVGHSPRPAYVLGRAATPLVDHPGIVPQGERDADHTEALVAQQKRGHRAVYSAAHAHKHAGDHGRTDLPAWVDLGPGRAQGRGQRFVKCVESYGGRVLLGRHKPQVAAYAGVSHSGGIEEWPAGHTRAHLTRARQRGRASRGLVAGLLDTTGADA